eukprot:snap_masked-scaffold_3-processed-gene-16.24-mRNA-1 protein AED:1.00 eAED:1.00 QI:0/0/0/0/1/1/2/0/1348
MNQIESNKSNTPLGRDILLGIRRSINTGTIDEDKYIAEIISCFQLFFAEKVAFSPKKSNLQNQSTSSALSIHSDIKSSSHVNNLLRSLLHVSATSLDILKGTVDGTSNLLSDCIASYFNNRTELIASIFILLKSGNTEKVAPLFDFILTEYIPSTFKAIGWSKENKLHGFHGHEKQVEFIEHSFLSEVNDVIMSFSTSFIELNLEIEYPVVGKICEVLNESEENKLYVASAHLFCLLYLSLSKDPSGPSFHSLMNSSQKALLKSASSGFILKNEDIHWLGYIKLVGILREDISEPVLDIYKDIVNQVLEKNIGGDVPDTMLALLSVVAGKLQVYNVRFIEFVADVSQTTNAPDSLFVAAASMLGQVFLNEDSYNHLFGLMSNLDIDISFSFLQNLIRHHVSRIDIASQASTISRKDQTVLGAFISIVSNLVGRSPNPEEILNNLVVSNDVDFVNFCVVMLSFRMEPTLLAAICSFLTAFIAKATSVQIEQLAETFKSRSFQPLISQIRNLLFERKYSGSLYKALEFLRSLNSTGQSLGLEVLNFLLENAFAPLVSQHVRAPENENNLLLIGLINFFSSYLELGSRFGDAFQNNSLLDNFWIGVSNLLEIPDISQKGMETAFDVYFGFFVSPSTDGPSQRILAQGSTEITTSVQSGQGMFRLPDKKLDLPSYSSFVETILGWLSEPEVAGFGTLNRLDNTQSLQTEIISMFSRVIKTGSEYNQSIKNFMSSAAALAILPSLTKMLCCVDYETGEALLQVIFSVVICSQKGSMTLFREVAFEVFSFVQFALFNNRVQNLSFVLDHEFEDATVQIFKWTLDDLMTLSTENVKMPSISTESLSWLLQLVFILQQSQEETTMFSSFDNKPFWILFCENPFLLFEVEASAETCIRALKVILTGALFELNAETSASTGERYVSVVFSVKDSTTLSLPVFCSNVLNYASHVDENLQADICQVLGLYVLSICSNSVYLQIAEEDYIEIVGSTLTEIVTPMLSETLVEVALRVLKSVRGLILKKDSHKFIFGKLRSKLEESVLEHSTAAGSSVLYLSFLLLLELKDLISPEIERKKDDLTELAILTLEAYLEDIEVKGEESDLAKIAVLLQWLSTASDNEALLQAIELKPNLVAALLSLGIKCFSLPEVGASSTLVPSVFNFVIHVLTFGSQPLILKATSDSVLNFVGQHSDIFSSEFLPCILDFLGFLFRTDSENSKFLVGIKVQTFIEKNFDTIKRMLSLDYAAENHIATNSVCKFLSMAVILWTDIQTEKTVVSILKQLFDVLEELVKAVFQEGSYLDMNVGADVCLCYLSFSKFLKDVDGKKLNHNLLQEVNRSSVISKQLKEASAEIALAINS